METCIICQKAKGVMSYVSSAETLDTIKLYAKDWAQISQYKPTNEKIKDIV